MSTETKDVAITVADICLAATKAAGQDILKGVSDMVSGLTGLPINEQITKLQERFDIEMKANHIAESSYVLMALVMLQGKKVQPAQETTDGCTLGEIQEGKPLCYHQRCKTCRWFIPETETVNHTTWPGGMIETTCNIKYSQCRRHASIEISKNGLTSFGWPVVNATDWCGDWEGKPIMETHTYV